MMSSPLKIQPEVVADKVLKRAEISKVRSHQILPPFGEGASQASLLPLVLGKL